MRLKAIGRVGLGWAVPLLLLAVLAGQASSGVPPLWPQLDGTHPTPPGAAPRVAVPRNASPRAFADIPAGYLRLYVSASRACPRLSWQVLAGIGKVESDHGRSTAPGVRSGVNRAGCCAGPMQFNVRNGPPSTWDSYGDGVLAHVYDPAVAVPAAARKLCADGLAGPAPGVDPCPTVRGTTRLHRALMRYNNACWYAHEVITTAERYTTVHAPRQDPFLVALVHNPNITSTRARGCDPAPDLASGTLDLRVQSLLAVVAERWRLRISCLHTGHTRFVRGTRRVSNHAEWRAVDIDQVDGGPVGTANQAAHALVAWLDRLEGPLRPDEIGSPWDLGRRPYFSDDGHKAHLHIGYGS